MTDFDNFCESFNIVDNALSMRNLIRWNGRDIRKENLSEHTHLVVACTIQIYDELPERLKSEVNFEKLIKVAMLHDSLELLRGDILSITKDVIPGLRSLVTSEETKFIKNLVGDVSDFELDVVELGDLKACNKFVEYELRYPNNNFALTVFKDTEDKYNDCYKKFKIKYDLEISNNESDSKVINLVRGHKNDAGIDIVLDEKIKFMPHSTTVKTINLQVTPEDNEFAYITVRSSAAIKGLNMPIIPIDSGYKGDVTLIVHNISNNVVTYDKGASFCQIIYQPFNYVNCKVKSTNERDYGKWGSTDDCNN